VSCATTTTERSPQPHSLAITQVFIRARRRNNILLRYLRVVFLPLYAYPSSMGLIRPATPGFLVTLTATILLAVVSFSVPYFKSIFFLKASLSVQGVDGSVTFGALGYCLTLANGTSCSKPSIGYEFGTQPSSPAP
jgi:hypothetical protein